MRKHSAVFVVSGWDFLPWSWKSSSLITFHHHHHMASLLSILIEKMKTTINDTIFVFTNILPNMIFLTVMMTTIMKLIFFISHQHYHSQSQHPNYQGLHEDNNHQPSHRWRRHVLPALSHFLRGDFSTVPILCGQFTSVIGIAGCIPWKFVPFQL